MTGPSLGALASVQLTVADLEPAVALTEPGAPGLAGRGAGPGPGSGPGLGFVPGVTGAETGDQADGLGGDVDEIARA